MATQGSTGRGRSGKGRQDPEAFTGETTAGTTSPQPSSGAGRFDTQRAEGTQQGQSSWSGMIRQAATTRISDQKHKASEQIDHVAHALRQTTDSLRDQGRTAVADYARQAADQLERLSHRIDEKDLDELVEGMQRFARRQPALFVGAAFGVGLLGARFLKSSSERSGRYTASGPQYPTSTAYPTTGSMGTGPDLSGGSDLPGGGPIS
jgi:hypothetical protein